MGCFDSVVFNCPKCGEENCVQSKAGDCSLSCFPIDKVPVAIAQDIRGDEFPCTGCGVKLSLGVDEDIKTTVPMVVRCDN